ncbi:sensor histidine kinase [Cohnella lupini]|uniref:histidine kinase n=1 Tax=Cohnella lupini TaxID=1294267 RepID=A0A3D9IKZ8_9BACL|nr:sensor histidine kinase [Cohnella lupini]RED61786.1 histidine kinase/DNA gyrase B/HSP90-like ATPase [Cohnella lupini]
MKWLFLNRSVSAKIVWSSVLISLIPLLVLSYLFYRSSTNSLERAILRSSDQNAAYLSKDLDEYFRNISTSALQVYAFNRVVSLMEHGTNYNDLEVIYVEESLDNFYKLVQNKNKDIFKIMLYGKDDTLRDFWSRAASYDSIKFEQSIPNYKEMLNLPFQHNMMFTYSDRTLGQDFFVYAITIYDPFYKKKFGSMVFYVQMKDFLKTVEANNQSPNVIVLQNGNGETFYQTNDRYANAVKPFAHPGAFAANNPRDVTFTRNKDLFMGTSYLDNSNIGFTIIYPNEDLAENRKNTLLLAVGALSVVMLIIFLFSLLAQRFITKPIQSLGKAMKAVRNGNFHVTLKPYRHRDDLSELTRNFNFMTDKIRELIELDYQMQLRNKEAQILALQMQINPHFLYNTLQTIGGKAVLIGDYEIHEMCRALGDMFRYSFYEGNMESTIGQELAHVNNYLYIQQFRFEDSLQTEFDVDNDLMDHSIVRFVLQPIIENVIVHAADKQGGRQLLIRISAARQGEFVVIEIRDNGLGMEENKLAVLKSSLERRSLEVFSGVSIGLKNVHERIKLVYGAPHGLFVESERGKGTTIKIVIPYRNGGATNV